MDIHVLTLFPEMVNSILGTSIVGRAVSSGLLNIKTKDIRDNALKAYAKVDDAVFGGGTGMLMMCGPIYDSYMDVINSMPEDANPHTIYMSPKGNVFDQAKAAELSRKENIIFICGHYEGIDQRVIDEIVDEELSIGDYVLTGGELPACVVIDAVSRLVPGVLPDEEAYMDESHMDNTLEHPQYTRPAKWKNRKVPDVLLSGHHKKIKEYNRIQSLYETMVRRPDLFEKADVNEEEFRKLIDFVGKKKY